MRKFVKFGDWHYFTLLPPALAMMVRNGAITRMAREYWYVDERE